MPSSPRSLDVGQQCPPGRKDAVRKRDRSQDTKNWEGEIRDRQAQLHHFSPTFCCATPRTPDVRPCFVSRALWRKRVKEKMIGRKLQLQSFIYGPCLNLIVYFVLSRTQPRPFLFSYVFSCSLSWLVRSFVSQKKQNRRCQPMWQAPVSVRPASDRR